MYMAPTDSKQAAMLAHIVSQTESNINFLVSQDYISQADASTILTKLPNPNTRDTHNGNMNSLSSRMDSMTTHAPPAPVARPIPSVPIPQVVQARALWAYNQHGEASDDLSFSAGDIIEIVEETNADWWLGRVHGKQALFPSNYVEKVAPSAYMPPSEKPAYKPFGAAYHGMNAPPPPDSGVNSIGLQQDEGQDKKKKKFGKYGNTMAQAAAGGVGFGAGAAIGGGLVNAIF